MAPSLRYHLRATRRRLRAGDGISSASRWFNSTWRLQSSAVGSLFQSLNRKPEQSQQGTTWEFPGRGQRKLEHDHDPTRNDNKSGREHDSSMSLLCEPFGHYRNQTQRTSSLTWPFLRKSCFGSLSKPTSLQNKFAPISAQLRNNGNQLLKSQPQWPEASNIAVPLQKSPRASKYSQNPGICGKSSRRHGSANTMNVPGDLQHQSLQCLLKSVETAPTS